MTVLIHSAMMAHACQATAITRWTRNQREIVGKRRTSFQCLQSVWRKPDAEIYILLQLWSEQIRSTQEAWKQKNTPEERKKWLCSLILHSSLFARLSSLFPLSLSLSLLLPYLLKPLESKKVPWSRTPFMEHVSFDFDEQFQCPNERKSECEREEERGDWRKSDQLDFLTFRPTDDRSRSKNHQSHGATTSSLWGNRIWKQKEQNQGKQWATQKQWWWKKNKKREGKRLRDDDATVKKNQEKSR